MDPVAFLADLEAKPDSLRHLADVVGDAWTDAGGGHRRRVLIGMGSSRFAALAASTRARRDPALDAVAEYASLERGQAPTSGTLAIGISASGSTPETVQALGRHAGTSTTVALTNQPGSPLVEVADRTVLMAAGEETGGVACRTFQHTLALLLALEDVSAATTAILRAAEATEDLLQRRDAWLPAVADILGRGPATYTIAPAERVSSAKQSALMFREGPRRAADACESGDWLHVDVYLTKPLDYRALLFAGSRFDRSIMDWVSRRGSTVVAVGEDVAGAAISVRYRHDDDDDVTLLTEVLVAELVAATWWIEGRTW